MRSYLFTLLLALSALVLVGLAAIRLSTGDLSRVFGTPPAKIGETLYQIETEDITDIFLAGNRVSAQCQLGKNGWRVTSPWEDRADPRVIRDIVAFTNTARVEGSIPAEKVQSAALHFEDGRIAVRIADRDDEPLAKYWIGHQTAWIGTDLDTKEPLPTIFVAPRDRSRKDYLYACTDPVDIHGLLGDGFKRLRDHHPFLFIPRIVRTIRLRGEQGELLLTQEQPGVWNITKPLGLKGDPERLSKLLRGLVDLEATAVYNRDEVTVPTDDNANFEQIALKFFGAETEIVLTIFPPETEAATKVKAIVSDRPNAVFELPLTRAPGDEETKVALRELPTAVNDLRDPTLTSIKPEGVARILISPAKGDDILISRTGPHQVFSLELPGGREALNDTALFSLLTTVTKAKVQDFVSDTATDLAPFALDEPALIVRFSGFDGTVIGLRFGKTKDGEVYVIREGTNTVVRVDPGMLALIPTSIWEWKDTLVWAVSQPDVMAVARQVDGQPKEELVYNAAADSWTASVEGKDVSAELNTGRANMLLKRLLDLHAVTWLPEGNEAAAKGLAKPSLQFELLVKTYDAEGTFTGLARRQLVVCEKPALFGRTNVAPNPFLLAREKYDQLSVDLFSFD